MSVTTHDDLAAVLAPVIAPPESLWRCSVAQYHEMLRAGILDENDHVELLDGWLVLKMTENPAHVLATEGSYESLARIVPRGWYVRFSHPITLAGSEPEPDLAVVRGDRHRYSDRHPSPEDLALVVEVADTTLRGDRTLKKQLYAQAGIPVYWVVDLVGRRLETYASPREGSQPPDYSLRRDYAPEEYVPVFIEGREVGRVPVGNLLP